MPSRQRLSQESKLPSSSKRSTPGGTPTGGSCADAVEGTARAPPDRRGLPGTARHTPQSLQRDADFRNTIVVRETRKFAVRVRVCQPAGGGRHRAGTGEFDRRAHRLQRGAGAAAGAGAPHRRAGGAGGRLVLRLRGSTATVRGVEIEAPLAATGPTTWSAWCASSARSGAAPTGARIAVASTVPPGAGLSSSAALTVAAAKALSLLAGRRLTPAQLVDVAYRAEHDQVGVRVRPDGPDHRDPRGAGGGAAVRDGDGRDPAGAVPGEGVDRGDRGARTGWSAAS